MTEENPTLDELLKSRKISQRTYDRVTVAKEYIERKYNLKAIINTKWNDLIEKIKKLNISDKEKNKIINEINQQESKKYRKNREKQSIYEYESLAIIGRGAFGEVHVCREIKTGNIYAIKKMKKDVLTQKNQVMHIRSEQLIMSKVKSPWIVDLKASFQEDDYLYLVMEYLPGGDFMSLLIKKDILTEDEARFYTAELILAIDSIHQLNCIHRDIKPDNILIDKNGHIKLSDFGLAKVSDNLYQNYKNSKFNKNKPTHQKNFSCVGTAYYVAPEVLNKKGYGKDIDWWSVGVIFFEMLVGYAPFCSEETKEVCYKVINWQKYLKIPDEITISEEAEDLINKMINNQEVRLGKNGIEEIKAHPFFKSIDWDNIRNIKAPFIPDIKNDYDTKYFESFQIEEPFYPPKKKFKKRKDIEFLGYTYKDGIEDLYNNNENEINEFYKKIIEKYNIKEKEKEKDNLIILHNKAKKEKNNNRINLLKVNNNRNNMDNKNISLNSNKSFVLRTKKQNNKINDGIENKNKNKGNSPPLFNRLNKDNNKINKKPLKTIKIADKKHMKFEPKEAKSANNSQKKYTNGNNHKNKIRFSPVMNDKKNNFIIGKKISNEINENKKIKFTNINNIKKATSVKNVKNNNINSDRKI